MEAAAIPGGGAALSAPVQVPQVMPEGVLL